MTTKKELLKQIEELQKKADAMPDVDILWVPKEGDNYWFIDNAGHTEYAIWVDDGVDQYRLTFGNIYQTKEQAEAAQGRRFAEVRVLRRIAELNAKQGWTACFDGEQENHSAVILQPDELACHSSWSYQALPAEHYGSKETIGTVMTEMEDDYRLMLGVISNE